MLSTERYVMKQYTAQWLRVKWRCSGVKNQAECDSFNTQCAKAGLFIDNEHPELGLNVQPEDTEDNPAMRAVAKIYLNCLWGKRGELEHNEITETCYDAAQLHKAIFDPRTEKAEIAYEGVTARGDPYVEVKVWREQPFGRPQPYVNSAACAFTTANARIRLHKMLLKLHWTQVVYCDSDSCIYWVDPNEALHWDPEVTPDPDIPLGDGMGDWEDEMKLTTKDRKNGVISKDIGVVVLGPKSYVLKILRIHIHQYEDERSNCVEKVSKEGDTLAGMVTEEVKAKGITMNSANAKTIHYKSMREIAMGTNPGIKASMFSFELKGYGGPIRTNEHADRLLRNNLHKRIQALGQDDSILFPPRKALKLTKTYHKITGRYVK